MIPFRAVQHYYYCPYRWQLLYQDGLWQDNFFTVRSEIAHERAHSGKTLAQTREKEVLSDVTVYSRSLGIYGKTDCLELYKDGKGSYRKINLIEYKPTAPKDEPSFADKMQVCAQMLCVKEIFSREVDCFLYYTDTRKRVPLVFTEEETQTLFAIIAKIQEASETDCRLKPVYGKKCNGCSMADRCMPKAGGGNVKKSILGGLA